MEGRTPSSAPLSFLALNEGKPSRTADRVAERRAQHQLADDPRVFDDPLALRIIHPDAAANIRANPKTNDSLLAPYLRAAFAVRSRLAEDALAEAVATRGLSQYVVLGAGFDTFAYRNPFPALAVLEVDFPATQAVKRSRLSSAGIAVPESVTYVPIDFASESLADALARAGFDRERAAFFSWLGVVPYLERDAIEATFRFVASLPAGSAIVFDYGTDPASLSWRGRFVFRKMSQRVAAIGEPWKTFFSPDDLRALLLRCGFRQVRDYDPAELNQLYFAGRKDRLRIGEMMHIAVAAV